MAITLTCECCKKKINAPDNAGGKWAKCPHCGFKCYIPLPPADGEEELKLAPIDENEETWEINIEKLYEFFEKTKEFVKQLNMHYNCFHYEK